jgi:alpha-L-rhamnosidase
VELIRGYHPRIDKLFDYFRKFENEEGLLEDLESWNFVEWSMANQLTKNVNYPTNMLYSGALRAAAQLYGDEVYAAKADAVLETVRRQSFDGQFFVDNALRKDCILVPSGERTEVCQYYAFFFGAATPKSHPQLLKTLVEDFGPDRASTGKWPQIHPANAFIGNYLRLDMLMQLGYRDTVRENIEGYFLYMAEKTGTLWENIGSTASCNHGFASYVLYWLDQLAE